MGLEDQRISHQDDAGPPQDVGSRTRVRRIVGQETKDIVVTDEQGAPKVAGLAAKRTGSTV